MLKALIVLPELFRVLKSLQMPEPHKQNDSQSTSASPSARLLQFPLDPEEETAGMQTIGKWLELADSVLAEDKRRKRA